MLIIHAHTSQSTRHRMGDLMVSIQELDSSPSMRNQVSTESSNEYIPKFMRLQVYKTEEMQLVSDLIAGGSCSWSPSKDACFDLFDLFDRSSSDSWDSLEPNIERINDF
uniref:Uncharacterized protein n=1 Tax=Heterorhabditis bacteriophora TaxID=37862 RepID=A0A1I7XLX5_HETBA